MWIDLITENEAKRKLVEDAIDDLNSIGFFGALMEVCNEKNKPSPLKIGTEQYALRAAWNDGYMEAIRDIYQFKEKFVLAPKAAPAFKPTFGAVDRMLNNNDFNTKEEYEEFLKENGR